MKATLLATLSLGVSLTGGLAMAREDTCCAQPQSVSLVRLLAAPGGYEGKRVRVQGWCRGGRELLAVYLSQEDADFIRDTNGLWLVPEEKSARALPKVFSWACIVEGVFEGGQTGHLEGTSGAITRATRIEKMRSYRIERTAPVSRPQAQDRRPPR